MNLADLARSQSRLVYLLVGGMMWFGLVSYFSLSAREDPAILIRDAVVRTRAPGLRASQVESLVTRTLEESLREIPEVEQIRSLSMPEQSILHVEIKDAIFDLDQVWDEVRLKVDEAQTELPAGIPTPVVDTDFGDVAAVTAALSGPDYTLAELFDLAKHARDRLQSVPGTKKVEILGGVDERIYVELDEAKLTELQLSPDVLAAQLRARNVLGARGTLASGGRRLLVQPTGSFNELSALRALLVELPGGRSVPLDEIATVSHGYQDPPPRLAYVDGVRSLILSVSMNSEERVLEYAPRVIERIEEIRGMVPVGVELTVFNYQADAVARAVFGVTLNVGETLGIVLAVVILFLGLRTGLIVGAIVPSVMLITLGVMGFVGMDLQRMSLATLVIALGLLVDNGIVVAEDFKRRLEAGAHRDAALSQVGRELAWPLFSSTLTTILVFLPLMLAENVAGEYTRSISQVILISLLTSWLLAMTLTPLLCHRFIRLRPARSGNGGFETLNRHYGTVLRHILRRPLSFLAGMAVLLVVAGAAMSAVPKRFFPDSDRSEVLVYLDLSPDAGVEATDAAVRRLMARLEDRAEFPYVDRYAAYVGFGGPRFVLSLTPMDPAPNRAFLVVNARSLEDVDATIASLRKAIQEELPEAEGRVARMFLGPSDSTKIEVQVKGPDAEVVFGASSRLEAILRDVPGAFEIRSDWEGLVSTVEVDVDQARAQRAGASSAEVARTLTRVLSGVEIGEYRDGDDVFPILLRGGVGERTDLSRLETAAVSVPRGTVPLNQVAELRLVSDHARIAREDLERTASVEARNRSMTAEDMVPLVAPHLRRLQEELPPGHTVELDGVVAESVASQAALQANAPLCLGLMIVLLVAQFRSYRRPAIILGTIPLIIIGAAIGLWTMKANFGFMVILGLYSLAGIIINNAIVLIDRIDIERMEGPDFDAVVGASVRRFRPIVMTTVTTILGLLPLMLFKDPLFYGMASVMAFGLLVGTVLTLGVVPAVYALMFGIRAPAEVSP